jgi:hypothetical protein
VGEKNSSILVPYSPGTLKNLQEQIMEGSMLSDEMKDLRIESSKEIKGPKTFKEKEKQMLDIHKNIDDI